MLLQNGIMTRTKYIMIYKKWDIVLVPFHFTDLSKTKKRPGLIISPTEHNSRGDIVIMFVTSNLKAFQKLGDYKIKQWKKASLPKPSIVRMKFATISENIIIKKIGKLDNTDAEKLKTNLFKFFDL